MPIRSIPITESAIEVRFNGVIQNYFWHRFLCVATRFRDVNASMRMRAIASVWLRAHMLRTCRKAVFYKGFLHRRQMRDEKRRVAKEFVALDKKFAPTRVALILLGRMRQRFFNAEECFFHCVVVDANKCMSRIAHALIEVATTHRLGEQHGEESKEGEEGEEGEEEALIRLRQESSTSRRRLLRRSGLEAP